MAERGYGSNLKVSTGPTVAQQSNVDRTRGEQNAYAARARMANVGTSKPAARGEIPGVRKPGGPLPATPNSLPGGVVRPSVGMHQANNRRQFGKIAGRLKGMLRRGR